MSHPGTAKSGGLPKKDAFQNTPPVMKPSAGIMPKTPTGGAPARGKGGNSGNLSAAKSALVKQQKGCGC